MRMPLGKGYKLRIEQIYAPRIYFPARLDGRSIMYAIIENGNKQYKVAVGDIVSLEKLSAAVGEKVEFPAIFVSDERLYHRSGMTKPWNRGHVYRRGHGDHVRIGSIGGMRLRVYSYSIPFGVQGPATHLTV